MMAKVVYELKKYHHQRAWRNGDLEDETILEETKLYKTRKDANWRLHVEEAHACHAHYKRDIKIVHRGNEDSSLIVWTNDTWTHENTGEEQYEYFWYVVKKITL